MAYETETIKGKLFEDNIFSFPIRVYYEDTDAGGIVYYANYLKFAERARTEHLRYLGIHQEDMLKNKKMGFVVKDCKIDYKSPAKLDDALNMTSEIRDMKSASFKMVQKLYRGDTVLAEIEITAVFLTFPAMRPTKIPEEIASLLR